MDKFQYLGFLLDDTTRLYARQFEERSRALFLELPHCKALVVLASNPGINQTRLAEICHLDRTQVTRVLDLLEALGWAQRRPDPCDRRAHSVGITPDAQPVLRQICSVIGETHLQVLRGFSAAEIRGLADMLEHMRTNLGGGRRSR
jgi:MarR family transcriptional regulator, transcriptional regulator for hemolysin